MHIELKRFFGTALTSFWLGSTVAVAQTELSAPDKLLLAELSLKAQKEADLTVVEGQLRLLFDMSDLDADGVVAVSDAVISNQLRAVAFRKSAFELWAEHNLNADMTVTAEEIAQSIRRKAVLKAGHNSDQVPPTAEQIKSAQAELMDSRYKKLIDPNGDGDITYQELLDVTLAEYPSELEALANLPRPLSRLAVRPVFDTNGNGEVSREEFDAHVSSVIAIADPDKNGRLNKGEKNALRPLSDQGQVLARRTPTWLAVAFGAAAVPAPSAIGPKPPGNMKFIVRFGNDADNVLGGTTGPDIFRGVKGDDQLVGYEGVDSYLFSPGDGNDVIKEVATSGNLIRFLSGVTEADLTKSKQVGDDGSNDLLIGYGTGDTILVKGWFDWPEEVREAWAFEFLAN